MRVILIVSVIVFLLAVQTAMSAPPTASNAPEIQQSGKVVTFDETNFEREVLETQQPVVVVFVSTLSKDCEQMAPVIKELAGEFDGRVKFGTLNIDANVKLADRQRVTFTPAFVLFKQGKPTKLGSRVIPKADLAAKIKDALAAK